MRSAQCRVCGYIFQYPSEYGEVRYCSANCRVLAEPPTSPVEYKGCTSSKYYTKARRKAIREGDKIDALVVFENCGWRCGICFREVDKNLCNPHPESASLDHIVPLSLGGEHRWYNVRLAHLGCNMAKGAA
jgi:5-methylcytosine-specific restriction endonuclease McrA